MKKTKTKSFIKPKDLWFDMYHVYKTENVRQLDNGQYEFDLTTYDKDEYIIKGLADVKTQNDLALAQLASKLGGEANG